MDNYEREMLQQAIELLHRLAGRIDSKKEFKPLLRFAQDDDNVIPFPGNAKKPPNEVSRAENLQYQIEEDSFKKEKMPTQNEAGEAKQGFVEFTDKEIQQMPMNFRRLIIIQKKRCRMRKHISGKDTTTYEIRYRSDGYDISACGKTIELAKANMIKKMRTAKPKEEGNVKTTIQTTLEPFALYYWEKFRKPKIAELTYKNDFSRLKRYIFPVLGNKPLKKITPSDCESILSKIKGEGKGKTADEVYSLLSVIFKGAIAHGIIDRNPLLIVPHFQHEREHGKALSRDEEAALFQRAHGTPYEILFALILYCGLRPNELKTVKIDGAFIIANNSKRKNKKVETKRIPICKRLAAHLDPIDRDLSKIDWRADKTLSMRFPTYCPGHKLYDLRTTFYTRCDELDVAEPARDEFVGHSSGVLTKAYRDLSDEYLLKEGKKLDLW